MTERKREAVEQPRRSVELEELEQPVELTPEQAEETLGGIWDHKTRQSRQTSLIQDL